MTQPEYHLISKFMVFHYVESRVTRKQTVLKIVHTRAVTKNLLFKVIFTITPYYSTLLLLASIPPLYWNDQGVYIYNSD